MGEIALFETEDRVPAFRDSNLRGAQSEGRNPDPAVSILPPVVGSTDNLQVGETAGAQSPKHAPGDPTRAGPGQEVVLRALSRA